MNFLSVGFVLCAMNFNLGCEMNYGVRLAGALFMLAGLAEADSVSEGFKAFRGRVMGIAGISAGGLAVTLLLRFGVIPEKLRHPLSHAVLPQRGPGRGVCVDRPAAMGQDGSLARQCQDFHRGFKHLIPPVLRPGRRDRNFPGAILP